MISVVWCGVVDLVCCGVFGVICLVRFGVTGVVCCGRVWYDDAWVVWLGSMTSPYGTP